MSETEKLLEIIEAFREKNHYYVDQDCWYSCPAHEDYCGDSPRVCTCGIEKHNARVDEALRIVRGLTTASTRTVGETPDLSKPFTPGVNLNPRDDNRPTPGG